jgi:hypothetical protein
MGKPDMSDGTQNEAFKAWFYGPVANAEVLDCGEEDARFIWDAGHAAGLAELERKLADAKEFARDVSENYDHDDYPSEHVFWCRKCKGERLYAALSPEPPKGEER